MRVCSAVRIVIIRIFIFKIKDFNQIYLEIRPTVASGVDRPIGTTGGKIRNFTGNFSPFRWGHWPTLAPPCRRLRLRKA